MKKLISFALAAVLAFSMAACGSKPAEEPADSSAEATTEEPAAPAEEAAPAADSGEVQEITIMYWDNAIDDVYKQMAADFEAQNPNIKLKFSTAPWADYWTKLSTSLPTGEGPDIFWLNHPNAITYMPSGHLMDLTADNLDMSAFDPNLVEPYQNEGKTYGVPIFFDTIAMFYNKALFKEAGVPEPTADWTWDQMKDAAKKLTKGEEQYGLLLNCDSQSGTSPFIFANGGHMYSDDKMKSELNNPETKEAIQYMLDLIHKDKVAPTIAEFKESNLQGELFQNGIGAMEQTGLWRISVDYAALGEDLGIAPLPLGKAGASSTVHNLAYCASAKTKHPEAVKKFMEYATTKAHGDFIAQINLPAHKDAQQAWFDAYPSLNLKVFTDMLPTAHPLPCAGKNAGQVFTVYENEIEKVFANPEVGDSLKAVDDAINAEIAK